MVELQKQRVEQEMTKIVDTLDKQYLRKIQVIQWWNIVKLLRLSAELKSGFKPFCWVFDFHRSVPSILNYLYI